MVHTNLEEQMQLQRVFRLLSIDIPKNMLDMKMKKLNFKIQQSNEDGEGRLSTREKARCLSSLKSYQKEMIKYQQGKYAC